ncbi:MAG: RnfABCDGE type electron transport complex subunit D [Ruminococcus sp.]|nr:RnfABCDGE type electron transport complex subunit D [Ruminococcus sp.]
MNQKKESRIWLDEMITLLPLALMAFFYYGVHFAVMAAVCIFTGLAAEFAALRLMHREFTADDLMCTSDALIIALMFPAVMDYKIAFLAVLFGSVVAKNVFGGRRNMIFSPAAAAYVFTLTSWGRELLMYPSPHAHTGIAEKAKDLVVSASHTFNMTGKMEYSDFEILMGNFSGPCGAVSIMLLVIAAAMLIFRKDISAGAFIGTISGTAVFAFITPMIADRSDSVKYSLVTNMVLFAAIYIVSDRRTAPKKSYYAFFYGFFIAVASYILIITTAQENTIVLATVLFTPAAMGFRMLEHKIEQAEKEQAKEEAAR